MKDLKLWQFIKTQLERSEPIILMVVVNSEYSSPGKPGFKMAVSKNKKMAGSIGGGKMEVDLVNRAVSILEKNENALSIKKLYHHGDTKEDSSGMICSGAQTVVTMTLQKNHLSLIQNIIHNLNTCKPSVIRIDKAGITLQERDVENDRIVFHFKKENEWIYQENIGSQDTIYIIGGGHVGLALSKVMALLDFYTIIIDDRPDLQTMELNSFANEKIVSPYNEIDKHLTEGESSYIAIVSHSHESDKFLLQRMADKNFKYIGLMGSKAKVKNLINDIRSNNIPEELIKKIHTPIGLDINSETPEEIAISIAAEIIKVRNS